MSRFPADAAIEYCTSSSRREIMMESDNRETLSETTGTAEIDAIQALNTSALSETDAISIYSDTAELEAAGDVEADNDANSWQDLVIDIGAGREEEYIQADDVLAETHRQQQQEADVTTDGGEPSTTPPVDVEEDQAQEEIIEIAAHEIGSNLTLNTAAPATIVRQPTDLTEDANTESETLNFSESRDSTDLIVEVKRMNSSPEQLQSHAAKGLQKEAQPNGEHLDDAQPTTSTLSTNAEIYDTSPPVASHPANALLNGVFGLPVNTDPPESLQDDYINHGLAFWEHARKEWLGPRSDTDSSSAKAVAAPVDVDEIIDVLFATPKQLREEGGPRKFPQPVALPQMIDLLTDLWEAEGLDT
ncbi:hypothetical protein MPSEU_000846400 [Mayamaea pseudoterrestris]|nr:hypothetical protein MPSEU_000846400 [Mayamaea pseudoterrestris]